MCNVCFVYILLKCHSQLIFNHLAREIYYILITLNLVELMTQLNIYIYAFYSLFGLSLAHIDMLISTDKLLIIH